MPTDRAQDTEAIRAAHSRDYLKRTIETVRNHRDADNCWPQWANIFADEIERCWTDRGRLVARLEAAERDRDEWKRLLFVAREWGEKLDRHCTLVYAELDRALGAQAPKAWERIEAALAAAAPGGTGQTP